MAGHCLVQCTLFPYLDHLLFHIETYQLQSCKVAMQTHYPTLSLEEVENCKKSFIKPIIIIRRKIALARSIVQGTCSLSVHHHCQHHQLEQVRAEGRTMAERVGRQLGDRDNAHAEKVTSFLAVFPQCYCL